jgi:hypothetical protein
VTVKPTATSSDIQPTLARNVDVTVMWGATVIGNHRIKDGERFTIGRSDRVTFKFTHPSLLSPAFTLVKFASGQVQLASATGVVCINDETSSSDSLALGDVGRIVVGPLEFVVRHAKRSAAVASAFSAADFFYGKVLALMLILHAAFVISLMITPSEDDGYVLDAETIIRAQQRLPHPVMRVANKRSVSEGVVGKPAPERIAATSKPSAPKVDKNKRQNNRTLVAKQLAALGLSSSAGAVSDVFGRAGTGINQALNNINGAAMGDAGGGMDVRATGAGSGGTGFGIGGLGSGNGRVIDFGGIDLIGHGNVNARVVPGKIIYEGGLSKEEIQRVISRVMSQIRFCYERKVVRYPNLEGKLAMFWTITSSGDVAGAAAAQNTFTGPAAPAIEQCVQRIIALSKFPSPKGGGVVSVTYPFHFTSSVDD